MMKKPFLAAALMAMLVTGTACAQDYLMRPGDELNIVVTSNRTWGIHRPIRRRSSSGRTATYRFLSWEKSMPKA